MINKKTIIALLVASILSCLPLQILARQRIKDLSRIAGIRNNHLVGYGLVVGLEGTGDGGLTFANQSFRKMLAELGITIPAGDPKVKNIAAVALHATLPPFAKPGQTIDVTVSSIGTAKSLRGGSLLIAPLKGPDGQVYALAQGDLVVGGFGANGADGSKISVNVPVVGRIPNGAQIERGAPTPLGYDHSVVYNLINPDFTTAKRLTDAINHYLGPGVAAAIDPASIRVSAPSNASERVAFISVLENLTLDEADAPAKIIVNARTGTIVIGKTVKVSPAAVTHGNLTVTISENPTISQPAPFSATGTTSTVADTTLKISQENKPMFVFKSGTSLQEIVNAVNQVGAAPGDLMAILEALKQSGALHAELIII